MNTPTPAYGHALCRNGHDKDGITPDGKPGRDALGRCRLCHRANVLRHLKTETGRTSNLEANRRYRVRRGVQPRRPSSDGGRNLTPDQLARKRAYNRDYQARYRQRIAADPGRAEAERLRNASRLTAEYLAWSSAKRRVTNPANKSWSNYGGRGIRMADEWLDDFQAFLAHIGPRPGEGYSLDRINNDGHYEPGNVRWATASEQAHNRRITKGRADQ